MGSWPRWWRGIFRIFRLFRMTLLMTTFVTLLYVALIAFVVMCLLIIPAIMIRDICLLRIQHNKRRESYPDRVLEWSEVKKELRNGQGSILVTTQNRQRPTIMWSPERWSESEEHALLVASEHGFYTLPPFGMRNYYSLRFFYPSTQITWINDDAFFTY